MFNWIPLEYYSPLFYFLLLSLILVLLLDSHLNKVPSYKPLQKLTFFLLIFSIFYIGLRPISGRYFGDTATYARIYNSYMAGASVNTTRDVAFNVFMKISSYFINVHLFFTLCAILYVGSVYKASKIWFRENWFLGFVFLLTTFSFWVYGTNGVRNGIAGSLFIFALTKQKLFWRFFYIVLSILVHKSMLLPVAGFLLANLYNKPKKFIFFWLLCIPSSLIAGGVFEAFFGSLGFDDRLSYLTDGNVNNDEFSSTGFRWDFLLYSSTAIFAGWYYIIKKEYKDKVYFWLFNTYVFANAFWILVIRANFSNRFAYLSWFMIALVTVYPLLRVNLFKNQYKKLVVILILQFCFTFLMNVILS